MGRYKRLGINTGLIFLGTAGSKLITFLMLPLYTRWLNVNQYGAVDLVTTYTTLFLGIVSLSIFDSIFIFPKDQSRLKQSQYFSSAIIFGISSSILSLLLCLCAMGLSSVYGWHGFLIDHIWQIAFLLISNYIQQLIQQFNRSIDKMNVYAFTGLIQTIGMMAVSFYIIPKYKVNGYIGSLILGNVAGIIYSLFAGGAYKYFSFRRWDFPSLRKMLRYSVPLIPNGIMWFLVNSINRPLLEEYHGLSTVGLLAIAGKLPTIINQVYMIFQNAFTISVLEEAKNSTYPQFYNQTLKMVVVGQIVLVAVVAVSSKWIIQHFTTPEFYGSWQYIPLLTLGVIFTNVATFVGTNFVIKRESKYYFYATIWAGMSALLFNFLMIPKLSIWGACLALMLSQFVGMFARIRYSWKTVRMTGLSFYFYNVLMAISLIAIQISHIPQTINLIASVGIAIVFILINRSYILRAKELIWQSVSKKI